MGNKQLIRVEYKPGQLIKLYRSEAKAAGLLKSQRATENKVLHPEADKDVLTAIPGIGAATAQKLRGQGITTLAELRQADPDELPGRARAAIERLRGE